MKNVNRTRTIRAVVSLTLASFAFACGGDSPTATDDPESWTVEHLIYVHEVVQATEQLETPEIGFEGRQIRNVRVVSCSKKMASASQILTQCSASLVSDKTFRGVAQTSWVARFRSGNDVRFHFQFEARD